MKCSRAVTCLKLRFVPSALEIVSIIWGADHPRRLHCISSWWKPHILWRWMNVVGYCIQELKILTVTLNRYPSAIWLFIKGCHWTEVSPCEQLSGCAGMFRLCCTLELFQETALQKKYYVTESSKWLWQAFRFVVSRTGLVKSGHKSVWGNFIFWWNWVGNVLSTQW